MRNDSRGSSPGRGAHPQRPAAQASSVPQFRKKRRLQAETRCGRDAALRGNFPRAARSPAPGGPELPRSRHHPVGKRESKSQAGDRKPNEVVIFRSGAKKTVPKTFYLEEFKSTA